MINPIAFSIGPISIHWYAIAYLVALGVGIWIATRLNRSRQVFKDNQQIFDFAFWIFLIGVFLGGRLGYILFYNFSFYLEHPSKLIAVWEGGMSFHGGLIGSVLVAFYLARKHQLDVLKMADLLMVPSALTTAFTRLANFVNRELVGRAIENPNWEWLGVDFGDGVLRYPSQLFQSAGAVVLFLLLLWIYKKSTRKGVTFFSYFILHGVIRFILEFWRQPDEQIGFIFDLFSMGQLLSLLTFLFGLIGLGIFKRRQATD